VSKLGVVGVEAAVGEEESKQVVVAGEVVEEEAVRTQVAEEAVRTQVAEAVETGVEQPAEEVVRTLVMAEVATGVQQLVVKATKEEVKAMVAAVMAVAEAAE
jgi:DNA integrity scanning protein DisA with diadenylate cyclase activity